MTSLLLLWWQGYLFCVYMGLLFCTPLSYRTVERLFLKGIRYGLLPFSGIKMDISAQLDYPKKDDQKEDQKMAKQLIVVICNHPGVFDFLYLLYFHALYLPSFSFRFAMKDSLRKIPLFGSYLQKYHLLLSREKEEDQRRVHSFGTHWKSTSSSSCVLYIFPESTSLCKETKEKSERRWYQMNPDQHHWKYLLFPFTGALSSLSPFVDQWYDATLWYTPSCTGKYEKDYLGFFPNLPRVVHLTISPCDSFLKEKPWTLSLFRSQLFSLWTQKDEWLEKTYGLTR